MVEETPQARLIAQWRARADAIEGLGSYAVDVRVAMNIRDCADELEAALLRIQGAHVLRVQALMVPAGVSLAAALLPQPAPPHWLLEKVRFALDEARRTISVGHSVRDHIEAVMAEMEYFEMMMAKTNRADIAAPPPPPSPKEGPSLLPQPAERPQLESDIERLVDALEEFGAHDGDTCGIVTNADGSRTVVDDCTCGLDAILAEYIDYEQPAALASPPVEPRASQEQDSRTPPTRKRAKPASA